MTKVIVSVEADVATALEAGWEDFVEKNNLVRGPEILTAIAKATYCAMADEAIIAYLNSPEGRVSLDVYEWSPHRTAKALTSALINSPSTNLISLLSQMCYAVSGELPDTICDEIVCDIVNEMDIPDMEDEDSDDDVENRFGISWPLLKALRGGWDVSADEDLIDIFASIITDNCHAALSECVQWGSIESLNDAAKKLEQLQSSVDFAVIKDRIIVGTF